MNVVKNVNNKSQAQIQAAMDSKWQELTGDPSATFTIKARDGKTAQEVVREIFDELAFGVYEPALETRLSNSGISGLSGDDYSNERLALISLEYNNGNALIGSGLKDALANGNRFEAWYQIRYVSNDGQDTINNFSNISGETDELVFSGDIAKDDLWFTRNGDNLVIDVSGSEDQVTVDDWFVDDAHQIDEIHAGGEILSNTDVGALVSAMASFDNPATGNMEISQQVKDEMTPTLVASWHKV